MLMTGTRFELAPPKRLVTLINRLLHFILRNISNYESQLLIEFDAFKVKIQGVRNIGISLRGKRNIGTNRNKITQLNRKVDSVAILCPCQCRLVKF